MTPKNGGEFRRWKEGAETRGARYREGLYF